MSVLDPITEVATDRRPRVVVFGTTATAASDRIARAFFDSNCDVATLVPGPAPLETLPPAIIRLAYRPSDSLRSLAATIRSFAADIVVPICDRALRLLHRLHYHARRQGMPELVETIERSLGRSRNFAVVENRYALLAIARQEGVTVPEMMPLLDECDFAAWKGGFPSVLKADGRIGGEEVRLVRSQHEACSALTDLRRKSPAELLKQLTLTRERRGALAAWVQPPPAVMIQAWVNGQPATCAVAYWQGKVLATTAVEIAAREYECGPATVVDVVDGVAMTNAARRVGARLELSGIVEFDFVLERPGGKPYLIGMHGRATGLAALSLGRRRSLAQVFAARLAGESEPEFSLMKRRTRISLDALRTPSAAGELSPDVADPEHEPSLLGVWLQRLLPPRREVRQPWVYTEAAEPEQGTHGSKVA